MFRFLSCQLTACAVLFLVAVGSLYAQSTPHVAVSIKPLHSLVSAVMEGVATPELIVKGAGSEHGYALKPSDAELISKADVIFIAHPDMENFLVKPIKTLAPKAQVISLARLDGVVLLDVREGGYFEFHHHDESEGEGDHGHAHEGHDHGEHDFHFWLDPVNAKAVVSGVAEILSKTDAAHAVQYQANAVAYNQRLEEVIQSTRKIIAPVQHGKFIVFHDAYQYFEKRFGMQALASVAVDPERQPGAARIGEIRNLVTGLQASCVFSEPQFQSKIVDTLIEGTNAKTGVLDPLGADLEEGPNLYPQLIRQVAENLTACLSQG